MKPIIHSVLLKIKTRCRRLTIVWQAGAADYQPIANGLLRDFSFRETLWIADFKARMTGRIKYQNRY